MKKFLAKYENPDEKRLNLGLMNNTYDRPIVEYISDACKSLEFLEGVTYLGYDYIEDESKIDHSFYIKDRKRKKSKKVLNQRYRPMEDSRVGEMIIRFKLEGLVDIKRSKKETKNAKELGATIVKQSKIIEKRILIPLQDEDGYHTVKGIRYYMLYQLVDNSTYTRANMLIQRSNMPISLKRKNLSLSDIKGEEFKIPTYTISISKKEVPVFILFFAKMGFKETLGYFNVDQIIDFIRRDEYDDDPEYMYFNVSKHIIIRIRRYFFDKYSTIRSILFMIISPLLQIGKATLDEIDCSKEYWTTMLGSYGTSTVSKHYTKGVSTLLFYEKILDNSTKEILKVHPENKENTWAILRWMIMNLDELKAKDNLDLAHKRLRKNEAIAQIVTTQLTKSANRILSLGKEPYLKNLNDIFQFKGDILLNYLSFNDQINDQDIWSKLRYTQKGPQSLGANNMTSAKYRGIHPSYLGRFDINVCGSSDPGTTGILTPFCKTDGLYFEGCKSEPQGFRYEYMKDLREYMKSKGYKVYVGPSLENEDKFHDFYSMDKKNNLSNFDISKNSLPEKQYYRIKLYTKKSKG